ncbi:FecR family protein, partial [Rubrivivax gelatinosus]|uniref:FecR family protein n=1 Tax=Rubrivivax gelatinosus TaxID=28068 RepID=UPI001873282A
LADGTRLALNSGSAVDLRYGATERRLVLRRGEILVETAPDPSRRPFVVQTGAGELRPLGTRFRVRDRGEEFELAVYEGAVEVRPATGAARVLAAGEQARFDAAGVGPEIIAAAFRQGEAEGCVVVGDPAVLRRAGAGMLAVIDSPADLAAVPPGCVPVLVPP